MVEITAAGHIALEIDPDRCPFGASAGEANKRLIAYHEVGHAITGSVLKSHDEVEKITLVPRGAAKGLTWFTPEEDQSLLSRSALLARIIGTLGGRAAEQVVFGDPEVTTGASPAPAVPEHNRLSLFRKRNSYR